MSLATAAATARRGILKGWTGRVSGGRGVGCGVGCDGGGAGQEEQEEEEQQEEEEEQSKDLVSKQ